MALVSGGSGPGAGDSGRLAGIMARAAALAVLWTLVAVVTAAYGYIQPSAAGTKPPWSAFLVFQAVAWYPWILFTPVVIKAARVLPAWLGRTPAVLAGHLALSLLIVSTNTLFIAATSFAVEGIPLTVEGVLGQSRSLVLALLPPHLISYAAIAGLTVAWSHRNRLRERELRAAQLESRLAEAQLRALRMQIKPHFLFNALNSIGALVRKGDHARADRMIALLGDLLRSGLLSDPGQTSTLRKELESVRQYLEIEEIRFADRLRVRFDIDSAVLDARVPSLVLQPLVENAVKHGISRRSAPGCITVEAREEGGSMLVRVLDDGPGPSDGLIDGVGLANVRERLRRLYAERQSLVVRTRSGGGASAEIRIPLTSDPVSAAATSPA